MAVYTVQFIPSHLEHLTHPARAVRFKETMPHAEHNQPADSEAVLAHLAEALAEAEDLMAEFAAEMPIEAQRLSLKLKEQEPHIS